jgi:hypothetical protein
VFISRPSSLTSERKKERKKRRIVEIRITRERTTYNNQNRAKIEHTLQS